MYSTLQTLAVDRSRIWHPFTQMKDYEDRDPIVITRAKGPYLYDGSGKAYYDTISSWWTNLHGHSHPFMNREIARQMKRLEHVNFSGFAHPVASEMIDRLSAWLPSVLSRFFFSDNGSTAVEVALKMAFQHFQNRGQTRKTRFVFLENSYHGDTVGAMSVGGIGQYQKLYSPLLFSSFRVPSPALTCSHQNHGWTEDIAERTCSLECFEPMKTLLETHHEEIAAVIVEPLVQCVGGMSMYPAAYLRRLSELTKKLGILLIFDEVATGFGRTGKMFALDKAQVVPDLLCLSKGLTGGYLPMALTVSSEEVYQSFYDDYFSGKTFFHGHSYTANPVGCSAAIASLKLFEKEKTLDRVAETSQSFHQELRKFQEHDFIGDTRFLGMIGAVDIVRSKKTSSPFDEKQRIGFKIYQNSLKEGLVLRPLGDTIYWFLPLCAQPKDIKKVLAKSLRVIQETVVECSR